MEAYQDCYAQEWRDKGKQSYCTCSYYTKLNVNLCDGGDFRVTEDVMFNYRDLLCQVMILDLGAPLSLAGIHWLEQYFGEFG